MHATRTALLAGLAWLFCHVIAIGQEPAYLRVHLPATAQLLIDGQPTKQLGAERLFVTPPLQAGRTYRYTLTFLPVKDNPSLVRMQVIEVRAGQTSTADLRPGKDDRLSTVVYYPTPDIVVEKMLELAGVTKDDVVFDLGCGDGRIIIMAAKKFGARGVGVDIDPERVKEAKANAARAGVTDLVEIRQGDALAVNDLGRATVVATYMLPEFMAKLRPVLQKGLKPGARIVAHDYPMPDWTPAQEIEFIGPRRPHKLYLWKAETRD